MKQVEIITSNHVAIEYELASPAQRIFAQVIDIITLFVYVIVMSNLLLSGLGRESTILTFIIILIPFFFYSFICESLFNGQTLGKLALRIKVITMDGKNPGVGPSSIRWVFRLVDIWGSAGALAVILSSSTERSQRIGDILANTTVINLSPKTVYTIEDVLSIKDNKEYTATYPGVVRFTDDDMLLLKNSLDRAKKYPNDDHQTLLGSMAERIKNMLHIQESKEDDKAFLKTILQDYIVLTRS